MGCGFFEAIVLSIKILNGSYSCTHIMRVQQRIYLVIRRGRNIGLNTRIMGYGRILLTPSSFSKEGKHWCLYAYHEVWFGRDSAELIQARIMGFGINE